jgi:anti-sigma regulatory factor (Ser/Thr protein kinase)
MPQAATKCSETKAVITLKRTKLAPKAARTFVRNALTGHDIAEDVIWDACLIASELTTNVVKHVEAAEEMRLSVSMRQGRPLIELWDPSPEEPVPVENPTGTSGRGLSDVVAKLATTWQTTFPLDQSGGKIISAWM